MGDLVEGLGEVKDCYICLGVVDQDRCQVVGSNNWVSVERFFLKLCWASTRMLCWSRCFMMFDTTICSEILQHIEVGR